MVCYNRHTRFVYHHTRMDCMLRFLQGHLMRAGVKYPNSKAAVCAVALPLLWQVIILKHSEQISWFLLSEGKLNLFWCIWSSEFLFTCACWNKIQKKTKTPFSDFKKAQYTHLFQLSSAREWGKTPHKGFDLSSHWEFSQSLEWEKDQAQGA